MKDIPYTPVRTDSARMLDLYLPESAAGKPWPLLVFIHGGAWISGGREEHLALGIRMARQGVAVAVVGYRLSGTDGIVRHPDHVKDCAAAIRWLRTNAAKHGCNPKRIFVAGHSAGAHMAAMLALDSSLRAGPVAGFIGLEGIYDLPALVKRWPGYADWFVSAAFGRDPRAWEHASPQRIPVKNKAPWLLIHSTRDELVDLPQSERFRDHLRHGGAPVELVLDTKRSHVGVIQALGAPIDPITKSVVDFIHRH